MYGNWMSILHIEVEVKNIAEKSWYTLLYVLEIVIACISLLNVCIIHGGDFDVTLVREAIIIS